MTDQPYDLSFVFESAKTSGLAFIGTEEFNLLTAFLEEGESVGKAIHLDVIFFAYTEKLNENSEPIYIPDGNPRRYKYVGKVISGFYNERNTKGKFVFEDGTILYYDTSLLK